MEKRNGAFLISFFFSLVTWTMAIMEPAMRARTVV
jgi:hypothetical protein